ncbi:MAG: FHA domain-containing protein [Deltaproteobacteria bacterium]|nr:FHA domain-containing protein [Deltaproteobacteria bacterium]
MARISIISNGKLVQDVQLTAGEMYIGRGDDATIQLKHPLISRKHARLYLSPAGYIIEDQGTKNGTFVGGRRVQRHRLGDLDELEIADFILRYHADGFVPEQDEMPPEESKDGGAGGMVAGDRKKDRAKSPLEAYMEALKRGGSNATAAIPPAAMARLREQARAKATPRLEVDGNSISLEKEEMIGAFKDGSDIQLQGGWFWVNRAVRITRKNMAVSIEGLSFWAPVRINGDKISEPTKIKPGDFIQVGKSKLKLTEGDAPF